MLAVRYLTLSALVVWLGGMATLRLLALPAGDALSRFQLVAYACGAIILLGLFILKFVGPPPPGFVPRVALVSLMLGLVLYEAFWSQGASTPAAAIEMLVGFGLLFWYVRE